jgi:hypothetical protein
MYNTSIERQPKFNLELAGRKRGTLSFCPFHIGGLTNSREIKEAMESSITVSKKNFKKHNFFTSNSNFLFSCSIKSNLPKK